MKTKGEPFKEEGKWQIRCGHTFCDLHSKFPGCTKKEVLTDLRATKWGRAFAKWFCPDCYQKYLDGTLPKGIR